MTVPAYTNDAQQPAKNCGCAVDLSAVILMATTEVERQVELVAQTRDDLDASHAENQRLRAALDEIEAKVHDRSLSAKQIAESLRVKLARSMRAERLPKTCETTRRNLSQTQGTMPDKIEHPPFTGDIDIDSDIQRLITERDELRAEVDRLRGIAWGHGNRADGAEAEAERLRADLTRAQAERDHLQLALNGCARAVERRREEGDRLRGYLAAASGSSGIPPAYLCQAGLSRMRSVESL